MDGAILPQDPYHPEASPTAAVLGPLQLDWDDPRLVVEAGLSTDAAGHRETGIGADELDLGQFATNSEVLAVGSAGSLVRRREWDALGGYDHGLCAIADTQAPQNNIDVPLHGAPGDAQGTGNLLIAETFHYEP